MIEIINIDAAKIEALILASVEKKADVHLETAAEIFGVPLYEVTPEQRKVAKSINYFYTYGLGNPR